MNILLVDDDRFIIEALREKINWDKLHIDIVYVAYSLTQAQNIIRENPIDLMISDIEMPQGSGLELLSWIRNEKYDIKTIEIITEQRNDDKYNIVIITEKTNEKLFRNCIDNLKNIGNNLLIENIIRIEESN